MKKTHVYYTPMTNSKRTEQGQENKSSLDDSECPPLTKSSTKSDTTTTTANTILNFLQAAKKPPAPETDPEEESLVNDDAHDDAEVEKPQFKKGFSFD